MKSFFTCCLALGLSLSAFAQENAKGHFEVRTDLVHFIILGNLNFEFEKTLPKNNHGLALRLDFFTDDQANPMYYSHLAQHYQLQYRLYFRENSDALGFYWGPYLKFRQMTAERFEYDYEQPELDGYYTSRVSSTAMGLTVGFKMMNTKRWLMSFDANLGRYMAHVWDLEQTDSFYHDRNVQDHMDYLSDRFDYTLRFHLGYRF